MNAANSSRPVSRSRWPIRIGALIVLLPCAYGFGTKFLEFIATFRASDDGVFVILPMINYLLATIGFSFMLFWSVMQGMFRDVEAPKYAFLAREAFLDGEPTDPSDEDQQGDDRDDFEPDEPNAPMGTLFDDDARGVKREEAVCHG